MSASPSQTSLKEQSTHTSATLSIVQHIEFIHKVIDVVASFGECAQKCDETDIVRLLQEEN